MNPRCDNSGCSGQGRRQPGHDGGGGGARPKKMINNNPEDRVEVVMEYVKFKDGGGSSSKSLPKSRTWSRSQFRQNGASNNRKIDYARFKEASSSSDEGTVNGQETRPSTA